MSRRSLLVALALICAACGSTAADAPDTTPRSSTTGAAPATTTVSTATSTTSTAVTTSTTVAPTTTVSLPVPVPVPTDDEAAEPRVELGTIEIPRIDVTKTLFDGIRTSTLDLGPGHWPGSALPGQLGNVVVGGHRTSHDRPFRNIDRLEPGDEVIFTTDAGRFVYVVQSSEVITPDTMRIIDQTNAHTATLFACEPPHSTKFRLVVHLALQGDGQPAAAS